MVAEVISCHGLCAVKASFLSMWGADGDVENWRAEVNTSAARSSVPEMSPGVSAEGSQDWGSFLENLHHRVVPTRGLAWSAAGGTCRSSVQQG